MTRKTWLILAALVALLCAAAGAWWFTARDAGSGAPAASAEVMVRPHSPVQGPVAAPVTIVEFFDPACEACRAFYPYVKDILARHPQDVRLVLRYVPLHGEVSQQAIHILEAAQAQQRLAPVLDALMATQPTWAAHDKPQPDLAWAAAVQVGLDRAKAQQFIASGAPDKLIQADSADAQAVGISGTPSFFVNGQPLTTQHPDALNAMVQQALGKSPGR
ncbi:thioredoxin domain-containing protein [Ottowia sp. GY511]|uniref:DsbA family protein n=1 Tax=Ottowia flava TaxID=2675430 RepID=A0ABW4KMI8_9BURK|nr:thioredoxin domain-containing protein [Ottowia sp. GY511]TXK29603.1 thioredoxin domain-containing protein [Ottowia sp. GY511]